MVRLQGFLPIFFTLCAQSTAELAPTQTFYLPFVVSAHQNIIHPCGRVARLSTNRLSGTNSTHRAEFQAEKLHRLMPN
jgi:hypothetical protein